jgi:hypothetical protein
MSPFNLQEFAEEYAARLQALEEYTPKNLFLPGGETANMGTHFNQVMQPGSSFAEQKAFANRYLNDYVPRVQQLARDANIPNISEELNEFFLKTGLPDERNDGFKFNLDEAQHEITSHLRPYKAGFMPDYRTLDPQIGGLTVRPNPVTPFNERFATNIDGFIKDKNKGGVAGKGFTGQGVKNHLLRSSGFENMLASDLINKADLSNLNSTEAIKGIKNFVSENYGTGQGMAALQEINVSDSVSNEIADQLNKKYLPQARYNYQSMGELMYPTGTFSTPHNQRQGFQHALSGSKVPELRAFADQISNPGIGYMSSDPFSATLSGAKKLIKENPTGTTLGVATSLLDPGLPQAIKEDDYLKAGEVIGRDILGGAVIEQTAKRGLPLAGRHLPQLAPVLQRGASILSKVSPVLTGAALFTQGTPGSLTDVVTQKAGANPISFLPSAKANPKTDIGARSGRAIMNEGKYIFNNLLKGRIPYMRWKK